MTLNGSHFIFVPYITTFGGVERLVLALSRFLHNRNASHTIVTFSDSLGIEREANWPVEVEVIQARRDALAEMIALRRWARKAQLSGRLRTPLLVFDLKGAFYANALAMPYIVHLTDPPSLLSDDISKFAPSVRRRHGGVDTQLVPFQRKLRAEAVQQLNRRGVRRARRTIVMTHAIAREIKDLYGVEGTVARPGVSAPLRPCQTLRESPLRFLSVSRLVGTKRIDWVLDSLSRLERTHWRGSLLWDLEVIGTGPEEPSLRSRAAKLGLENHVRFSGAVSETALEGAYDNASLFLMPAAQGWGLPALEALARRVPLVLHEDSGVAEILGRTTWVELVNGEESSCLDAAIIALVRRLETGAGFEVPLPEIPTEMAWAERISNECAWDIPREILADD